ncbi:hypothetical protein ACP6PL_15340 [Dapis sp. BLCC M126]|uniref:hypothetical protein n=1 Tax=Dapis sp. BLCC M126 TaxID=3400189 RepID=UPI003CFAEDD1
MGTSELPTRCITSVKLSIYEDKKNQNYQYQVGVSLSSDTPSYVKRQADEIFMMHSN